MTETEDLQAQVSALRLLVMSLIAQSPTDELINDAKRRLGAWVDMGQATDISEEYLDLMQMQVERHLQLLQTLRDQHDARMAQAQRDTSPRQA